MFFEKLISKEVAYLANESVLNLIYPTPIPLDLVYFTDEEDKLKLWRYVSHNLNEEYEKNILEAFSIVLNESKIFEIERNNSQIQLIDKETNTNINTYFLVVNGDVKVQDINDANEILNKDYRINLVVILYNGEFTQKASEALSIKSLGENDRYQIMDIQLHHSIAKKLLFGFKSVMEYKDKIDTDLFEGVCKEKIEEMNLKSKINDWLIYQVGRGLLINQIQLKQSRNPQVFADGLKLYLNYDGSHSPEEIHKLNIEGILKFKKYGTRKGFISSDFEDGPSEIIKVSSDLKANGFLNENDDKTFSIETHPVETRIWEIIKNKEKVSLKDLRSYFIIRDRNDKAFQDVFINILKYKGMIKQSGKNDNPFFEINHTKEALLDLKENYDNYKNDLKAENFKLLNHYYVRKLYSSNLILIDEFDMFLTTTYNEAVLSKDLLKINICSKILNQFNENFKIAINSASNAAPKIINDIDNIKSNLDKSFDNIVKKSVLWLNTNFDKNQIVEYKGLLEDFNDINDLFNIQFSKEELESEIKKIESKFKSENPDDYKEKLLEVFGFRKENTTEPYFNIKIYLLNQKKAKIIEKSSKIQDKLNKIEDKFDEINDRQIELNERLEKIKTNVSKNNKLSLYMYKQLESANISSKGSVKLVTDYIDLTSLKESSENSIKIIGDRILLVMEYTDLIEKINDAEVRFLKNLNITKDNYLMYKRICDTKNFEIDLKT